MKVRGVFIGINSEAYVEEFDIESGAVFDILEAGADYMILGLPGGSTVQYSRLPKPSKRDGKR